MCNSNNISWWCNFFYRWLILFLKSISSIIIIIFIISFPWLIINSSTTILTCISSMMRTFRSTSTMSSSFISIITSWSTWSSWTTSIITRSRTRWWIRTWSWTRTWSTTWWSSSSFLLIINKKNTSHSFNKFSAFL